MNSSLKTTALRGGALISITLWIGALFLPYYDMTIYYRPEYGVLFVKDHYGVGYRLLEWGWIGPFFLSIAWYANIFFVVTVFLIAIDRVPGTAFLVTSLLLAASALLPHRMYDSEGGSHYWMELSGPAVWLWLSSFILVTATSFFVRKIGAHRTRADAGRSPG